MNPAGASASLPRTERTRPRSYCCVFPAAVLARPRAAADPLPDALPLSDGDGVRPAAFPASDPHQKSAAWPGSAPRRLPAPSRCRAVGGAPCHARGLAGQALQTASVPTPCAPTLALLLNDWLIEAEPFG